MRLSIPILFLTLVVNSIAANAAPTIHHEPRPIEISPKDKSEPLYSSDPKERYWSFRLGFLGGTLSEAQPTDPLFFYGLGYKFLNGSLSTWQMEVSGAKDNFLHLVVGKKFYFSFQDTLPYYKFSAGDLIDSGGGLGSILNLKKIQAIAAIGLDDVLKWNQYLQAEIGVSYALIGTQLEISLGFGF
ncbi:MAG TPA: hypothetical protein VIG33_14175 [Pseudobdellovibrionaceae bacterium]|jgi:hypothetical protein